MEVKESKPPRVELSETTVTTAKRLVSRLWVEVVVRAVLITRRRQMAVLAAVSLVMTGAEATVGLDYNQQVQMVVSAMMVVVKTMEVAITPVLVVVVLVKRGRRLTTTARPAERVVMAYRLTSRETITTGVVVAVVVRIPKATGRVTAALVAVVAGLRMLGAGVTGADKH
jgi:hypothetical protein